MERDPQKIIIQTIKQDNVRYLSNLLKQTNVSYMYLIRNGIRYEAINCLEYLIDEFFGIFEYFQEKGIPMDVIKYIKAYSFIPIEIEIVPIGLINVLGKLFKISDFYPPTLVIKTHDDDPYNYTSVLFYAIRTNNMNLFNLLVRNGFRMNMEYIWSDKGNLMKIKPYTFCSKYGYYQWLDII